MKYVQFIAISMFFFLGTILVAQNTFLDNHFSQEIEKHNFDMVNINANMFERLAKSSDGNHSALTEVIQSLKAMKSIKKADVEGYDLFSNISTKLKDLKFEELSHREEGGEKVKIFAAPLNDILVKELIIVIATENNFYVLDMLGDIDLNKISKLSNIPGLEHLSSSK